MSSDQTKTAILTAAEMLWAERSFGEVTMRDIVAAAGVNLAAVNYHFGSKDELLADLFVSRTTVLNRERFAELKAAELEGGGRPSVEAILRALVGPPLRWCLSPDQQRSAAARFMTRASVEIATPMSWTSAGSNVAANPIACGNTVAMPLRATPCSASFHQL